jgi:hypothetical protein
MQRLPYFFLLRSKLLFQLTTPCCSSRSEHRLGYRLSVTCLIEI